MTDRQIQFNDATDGGAFDATEACKIGPGRTISVWEIHGNVFIGMDSADGSEHVQIVMTPADFRAFADRCFNLSAKYCRDNT